ncbi:MAG: hypothetical protein K9K79_10210 [Desulfohalobiaceae bacterium]|nr:hypothetical protein [Desulfohalobiaceae bacterium]
MDPYKILEVEPGADSREIVQAAALALRKRRYTGHEIALAQKELLDPVKRAAHAFLYCLDSEAESVPPGFVNAEKGQKQAKGVRGQESSGKDRIQARGHVVLDLQRLTVFDEKQG